MSTARERQPVSVEDYLAGEQVSDIKHEYVAGVVYAMSGGRNVHNQIAGNVFAYLHARLRGGPCLPFNSDTKIRIRLQNQVRFYYPDVSVVCQPNPADDSFQDQPVVLAEVLSRSTRRVDESEKKDSYLSIATLRAYLLIEQETDCVTVYRRADGDFLRELYEDDSTIRLPEIGTELPLSEIYDGVTFVPESES